MLTPKEVREVLRVESAKLLEVPRQDGLSTPLRDENALLRRMGALTDPDSEQNLQTAVNDHMTHRISGII